MPLYAVLEERGTFRILNSLHEERDTAQSTTRELNREHQKTRSTFRLYELVPVAERLELLEQIAASAEKHRSYSGVSDDLIALLDRLKEGS